jgi:tRNA A37 methylthiotransferase MiaB
MELKELKRPIAIVSAACRTVTAEWENWAQQLSSNEFSDLEGAQTMVIIGCQVTDLAILNDLRTAEHLQTIYPDKKIVLGACVAARDDISFDFPRVTLPLGIANLDASTFSVRHVKWLEPFWSPQETFLRDGVSVRTSRGCLSACAYCSINKVRGGHEVYPLSRRSVVPGAVLVADSPSANEVRAFLGASHLNRAKVSLRNLEPEVAFGTKVETTVAAEAGLLGIWHVPIQSTNPEVVGKMRRDPSMLEKIISLAADLRRLGVKTATNIIENFVPGDTSPDAESLFDHVSRNPYWNGHWKRSIAEARWTNLIAPK